MVQNTSGDILTVGKKEEEIKYTITVVCSCGYSVSYTLRTRMDDQQNCVGPCHKCGSNEMSLYCSPTVKSEAA